MKHAKVGDYIRIKDDWYGCGVRKGSIYRVTHRSTGDSTFYWLSLAGVDDEWAGRPQDYQIIRFKAYYEKCKKN